MQHIPVSIKGEEKKGTILIKASHIYLSYCSFGSYNLTQMVFHKISPGQKVQLII